MPRAGGAIQLANVPGSVTACMRLCTKALSCSVGSHSPCRASHSAWLITRPSGDTCASPNVPMARWKPRCGRVSAKSMPCTRITSFHRATPVAQSLVQGDEGRLLAHHDPVAVESGDLIGGGLELVVVLLLGLLEAPLEPGGVEVGGVGGDLRAEEVEGDRAVEVQVPLDGAQIDPAVLPEVVRLVLAHQLAGALDDAHDARLPHEHVVRFLGEHEATGARERIEAALGQARELILAVAVGEEAEHEVGEPVRRLLVEGAEDARLVAVSRAALEQRLRFLTPVAAKVGVAEVDHGPEVPSLLHVDLEQVTKVIE